MERKDGAQAGYAVFALFCPITPVFMPGRINYPLIYKTSNRALFGAKKGISKIAVLRDSKSL